VRHELPKLSYDYNSLEPYIDTRTMEIHHTKHHAGYVEKLNKALENHPALLEKNIEDLLKDLNAVPESIRQAVINNGGGHYNHSIFWKIMGPNKGGKPAGSLEKAITEKFGSFEDFKREFAQAALTRFGSGWAWLVSKGSELQVISTPNQDSPVSTGLFPIIGVDVWEHAYYLKYQNRRPDYVKAWWNVVNWEEAEKRFSSAW